MLETNTQKKRAMYSLAKLCRGYNNVIKYHEKDFDWQTNARTFDLKNTKYQALLFNHGAMSTCKVC